MSSHRLEEWLSNNTTTVLVWVAIAAVAFAIAMGGGYLFFLRAPPLSIDAATMGQVGDYFGGLLNPVFSFLSMLALLVALVLQSRELKLSTEELRNSAKALNAQNAAIDHQRFEQTFFAWLGTYRELLESVEEVRKRSEVLFEFRGRRALHYWWREHAAPVALLNRLRQKQGNPPWEHIQRPGENLVEALNRHLKDGNELLLSRLALDCWEKIFSDEEYQLDSMFRMLFSLLRWIDSQSPERVTNAQKWQYVSIVRAQLSWIELVFLFCNGYTARGSKFQELAERYALFDNLPFHTDIVISLLKQHPPDGVQEYASQAFASEEARERLGLPRSAIATLELAAKGVPQGVP